MSKDDADRCQSDQAFVAPILTVPESIERPFLSIMIPTWQPRLEYLEQAITSVLDQVEVGPSLQLEIVDDCSPDFNPYAFVERFPPGAISVYRNDERRGLAGNWNSCLSRARGRWVHLLHQDDFLLEGFYEALLRGIEREPRVAAAYCATYLTDASGEGWAPRLVPMRGAGILEDWKRHVFVCLSIQCSAIVVRRDVYETIGGFDASFSYALDWDMWKRVAVRYAVWYHPEPLACYRTHPNSETSRQRLAGSDLIEVFRSIDRSAALLPPGEAAQVTRRARANYAVFAVENAFNVARRSGAWADAVRQLLIARRGSSLMLLIAALAKVTIRGGLRAFSGAPKTRLAQPPASK